jgi:hypothetical protein
MNFLSFEVQHQVVEQPPAVGAFRYLDLQRLGQSEHSPIEELAVQGAQRQPVNGLFRLPGLVSFDVCRIQPDQGIT